MEKRGRKPPPKGRPFTGKDDPRNGISPGRPREQYLEDLRGVLHHPKVIDRLKRLMGAVDSTEVIVDDDRFAKLWDKVHDKLHPKQLELSQDPDRPLIADAPIDQLTRRLNRLAERLGAPEST